MQLSAKQVSDIAEDLICGMKIYINRGTLETKSILDWEMMYGDTDIWEQEEDQIRQSWKDHAIITKMESREGFQVMEAFAHLIDNDRKLQTDLFNALNGRKPFANFKWQVESSALREDWFRFKLFQHEKHVERQLAADNIAFEPGASEFFLSSELEGGPANALNILGANVTVMVTGMDVSVQFYTEVLGLTLHQRYGDHWAQIEGPGITIGLHPTRKDIARGENLQIGLRVEKFDEAIRMLEEKGISCTLRDDGQVRLASFKDPDGNILYLVEERRNSR